MRSGPRTAMQQFEITLYKVALCTRGVQARIGRWKSSNVMLRECKFAAKARTGGTQSVVKDFIRNSSRPKFNFYVCSEAHSPREKWLSWLLRRSTAYRFLFSNNALEVHLESAVSPFLTFTFLLFLLLK